MRLHVALGFSLGFFVALGSASGTARAAGASATTGMRPEDKPVAPKQQEKDTPVPAPDLRVGPPRDVGPHRNFAIEVTPLSLIINSFGAGIELMPVEHHVLLLSAYYFSARTATNPGSPGLPGASPPVTESNLFRGVGGELGYRYYWGHSGPRGLFVGPSLLLGKFQATPTVGDAVPFWNIGAAADVGYQAILAESWVVGLSAGAQYNFVDKTFPDQTAPATFRANAGLHPRMQIAIGYAFDL